VNRIAPTGSPLSAKAILRPQRIVDAAIRL